ncbi:MAG: rhomboid family intramembrane serine protease [Bacteroidota bacterium]
MQNERNFLDELKHQYKFGGMHMKLIFINVLIFIFIVIFSKIDLFTGSEIFSFLVKDIFTLQTDFYSFLYKPWGLVTSIFSHFGIMHILFNMLMLYFAGKIFEHYLGSKRLLAIYILGGIMGGIFEILAHGIIPTMAAGSTVIVGASGSIMAIFIGLAFYRPNLPVSLFGLFELKIIYLGLIYLAFDIFSLGLNDGTAHFAHLGGAIVGVIASQQANSSQNFVVRFEKFIYSIFNFFSTFSFKSTKSSSSFQHKRPKSDEDFNIEAKERQEKINKILDKISKSGYESLTKSEKEFLFKQSNNA